MRYPKFGKPVRIEGACAELPPLFFRQLAPLQEEQVLLVPEDGGRHLIPVEEALPVSKFILELLHPGQNAVAASLSFVRSNFSSDFSILASRSGRLFIIFFFQPFISVIYLE